jgi:hypothetical protein
MERASVAVGWAHQRHKVVPSLVAGEDRRDGRRMKRCLPLSAVALIAVAVGACGSSQPGYCGDRQDLRDAVDQLTEVNVRADGVGAIRDQLRTIQADAKTLTASAQSDFPEETSAISSSVDGLASVVQDVPSSPGAADVARIGAGVAATVKAVKAFDAATSEAC